MVTVLSAPRPDSCVVAEVRSSPNHNERRNGLMPDMIILHYTGARDTEVAIRHLCTAGSEPSAHYVVLQDGYIIQLVPESQRAWHAGVSSWAGESDVNSRSIAIEIANPGHEHGYPDFPRRQFAAVTALCRSILTRHDVPADRVLAHSDVAPARKVDPPAKNFLGSCSLNPALDSGSNLFPSPRAAPLMCSAKPTPRSTKCKGCLRGLATA
jgi:N-acetylmuramoyl-L-alanine amidase